MLDLLLVTTGVLLALAFAGGLVYLYVQDVTQERHAVLRNFPLVGHLRYLFESLGEYFRQYFFLGDRDEMPFDRATRSWVYRMAKNQGGIIGFGSTYRIHEAGALVFVNAPFPVLDEEQRPTPPLPIGEGYCRTPFSGRSLVNVSAMSFGAISRPAVQALSRGAAAAGCWLDTGEGGLSPYHLEGGCDIIFQIGTAKYGVRDASGQLSDQRLRELAAHECVRAFEIKLSQGAKPGKGGVLLSNKVTREIADIRGIPLGKDSLSPNRHRDVANIDQLLDQVEHVRATTGKPVGVKAGRCQDRDRRQRLHGRAHGGHRAPRSARRTRLPDHRWWRGRQWCGATGAGRPHGPVDRRSAAAGGRCTDRQRPQATDSPDRSRQAGDSGSGCVGTRSRCRFRQHGTRLHVFARLHPGSALSRQHLPDWGHYA
ncbi:MAG: Glutamate synthase [NADPH] large chain [Candidatus Accumulibacter sp. BA-94]|nr:MAG: Glutamate synthase [NADPH] large chain [Candidatus Accumulibacter sp. BA-94]